MTDNFDKIYLNMIQDSRLFYESCNTQSDLIVKHNFKNSQDLLDKIILEDYPEVNFGSKIINEIFNSRFGTQFTFQQIVMNCSKTFIEENKKELIKTKLKIPLYVYKFSFSNPKEFIYILRTFGIAFSKQDGTYKEKAQFEIDIFKNMFKDMEGLLFPDKSFAIMMLNSDKCNGKTVSHELGHYFQYVLSKHSKDDLPLSFSEQFEHMMKKREFSIYAKVDIFHQMEALYHKFYKNQMTTTEYFNFIIKTISDKDFTSSNLFKNYLKLYPNDSGSLLFFNYLYNEHKELFNEWKQYLAKIKDI